MKAQRLEAALAAFEDPAAKARSLVPLHRTWASTETIPAPVRAVVARSWQRQSLKNPAIRPLGNGDIGNRQERAAVLPGLVPMLEERLLHLAADAGNESAISDDEGYVLWVADAGFDLDFGDDDSGLFLKYLRRGSGYYIDIGASELAADGSIALAHGDVARLTEDSVVLDDGTVLPADAVVYATGYGSMNGWAAKLISQDVAVAVGKYWGLGSETTKDPGPWEGELRNMWKPTRQENLWFHGGNLHQPRHYSKYLALQLKARFEGIETPVYALAETHHAS